MTPRRRDVFAAVLAAAAERPPTEQEKHAEQVTLARRLYLTKRMSIPTAAREMGIEAEQLEALLDEAQVARRGSRPRRTGVRREIDDPAAFAAQIAAEYAAGESIQDLSLRHRLGKGRARQLIEAGGQTIRPVGSRKVPELPGQTAEIRRLHIDEGLTYERVRARLGVSHYRIAVALGLDTAGRGPRASKKGHVPPPRPEIDRLVHRYKVDGVGLVRLAGEENWPIELLRSLLVSEGVQIRGPGPMRGTPNIRTSRTSPPLR